MYGLSRSPCLVLNDCETARTSNLRADELHDTAKRYSGGADISTSVTLLGLVAYPNHPLFISQAIRQRTLPARYSDARLRSDVQLAALARLAREAGG